MCAHAYVKLYVAMCFVSLSLSLCLSHSLSLSLCLSLSLSLFITLAMYLSDIIYISLSLCIPFIIHYIYMFICTSLHIIYNYIYIMYKGRQTIVPHAFAHKRQHSSSQEH